MTTKQNYRILTGKELRIAAENGLKVRYILDYFDPTQKGYNKIVVMEPANHGYFIGPCDIDPDEYEDGEAVMGEFPEGRFVVCAALKKYGTK